MKSLNEVFDDLKNQHMKFIESNYHLHHPRLIAERKKLMEEGEVISEPWIEATPIYCLGNRLEDLSLPSKVKELLQYYSDSELGVYNPPYAHQATALEAFFDRNKDLIVSTGTGSGKTEIFLWTILGMLAREAHIDSTTSDRAIRALILYPMNALVADQLSRLRVLFGNERSADKLGSLFGRRIQFGMYTSRTQYHGNYDANKNRYRVAPIVEYYCDLQNDDPDLFNELKSKGRVPAKDLQNFRNRGGRLNTQYRTQPNDVELFTRQEMNEPNENGGTPDILITNYSMLEYMLLRPIEQGMFEDTKNWLEKDGNNQLLLVLDEAHLYRGAQGAEVALLIRRLFQHLNVDRSRVRFILTSASLGDETRANELAPDFAASLTSSPPQNFEVITGIQEVLGGGNNAGREIFDIFSKITHDVTEKDVRTLASELNWEPINGEENFLKYLGDNLTNLPVFRQMQKKLSEKPYKVKELSRILFTDIDDASAIDSTGKLLSLGSSALTGGGQILLPARLHVFFKGLPNLFICLNPNCDVAREEDEGSPLLGKMYTEPRLRCDCGARVFELLSHRTCGAAYIRAYRHAEQRNASAVFLWDEKREVQNLEEIHILLEEPRTDFYPNREGLSIADLTPVRYLDIRTGHLVRDIDGRDQNRFIRVWIPGDDQNPAATGYTYWSWDRCPACGIKDGGRNSSKIMDLETKGEGTFANLIRTMFSNQAPIKGKEELPNKGKKVLSFSDGRQKAAKLARDLQRLVEMDAFREVIVAATKNIPADETNMYRLFPEIIAYTTEKRIGFFDNEDETSIRGGYIGSRNNFVDCQKEFMKKVDDEERSIEEILSNQYDVEDLNEIRPRQYEEYLLRLLGDPYYSISATLVGFIRPTEEVSDLIKNRLPNVNSHLVEDILKEIIKNALSRPNFAYDPDIDNIRRYYTRGRYELGGGEGLAPDKIIPDYIKRKINDKLTENQWRDLNDVLIRPPSGERLFSRISNSHYVVNPKAVTLELALNGQWYRCKGCRQFAAWTLGGVCTYKNCRGEMDSVSEEDIHMKTRSSFLRDPCIKVYTTDTDPFTLRSEEHSAQLNTKDTSEIFAKSELYELLFQDIMIGEHEIDQPVDVLSCTTTMEVGIDIGSLTAVAMRTIPPLPENYQQRSGRAGRRGSGLSTIATFADNSPHETYYFRKPHLMVGAKTSEPIVYTGNVKIAERHINASLLECFFDPSVIQRTSDVFESLGKSKEFFDGNGSYTRENFKTWIETNVLPTNSQIASSLGSLLPSELEDSLTEYDTNWRLEFIQKTAEDFLEKLKELGDTTDWDSRDTEEDLLPTLLNAALLPTFSFPLDLCNFVVREHVGRGSYRKVKKKYDVPRGLKEALSEYIPGRQTVINKKTYTSYGLYFPFPPDSINRASGVNWDDLDWLNYCPNCKTILAEKENNLRNENRSCPTCSHSIESRQIFKPLGFSPEVRNYGVAEEGIVWEEERIYAKPASFPIPESGESIEIIESKNLEKGQVMKMQNQRLMVINFGLKDEGFHVCTSCGAVGRDQPLTTIHNRPYPIEPRDRGTGAPQCQQGGGQHNTVFGYSLITDLSVLRIPIKKPLNYAPDDDCFKTARITLQEALVLGASRTLGIDSNELAGGSRILPTVFGTDSDVLAYIEFFLYDTTSGGAGFSSKAFERFEEVLESTRAILSNCSCRGACHSCLRNYNNRVYHEKMNRQLGLALLDYVNSGIIPEIDSNDAETLAEQLHLTLELMEPNIQMQRVNENPLTWELNLDGNSQKFSIYSCLIEDSNDDDSIENIIDFNIINKIPEVAHRLIRLLKGN